jgi:glutaredoxin
MKRIVILSALAILSAAPAGAAQLYRWVDDKGNVEYRDTPPPSSAKKVEQRSLGGGSAEASPLPYSVQLAVRNFPVTLGSSACGAACDQARAHLARRGVPHTEKHPQADFETFQKLTGSLEVPVLFVGSTQIKGYLESDWDAALDVAGYPKTAPLGYKPAAKSSPAARPPVKLYTHPNCGAPCDEAKTLLVSRKVGFEEIVVEQQVTIDELQKVSGAARVPVLLVGTIVTRGFSPPDFDMVLDAAGFPRAQ